MKGITFTGNRSLEVIEFPDPTPGPRDVVLEIRASGMCGTDLGAYRSPTGRIAVGTTQVEGPVIAGHEPCGVVVALGSAVSGREAKVGDRVMDHRYDGCGVCRHCRSGWTQMCLEEAVAYGYGGHGAHAQYMKVAAHSLVPLPEEVSFVAGAAVACGTGTAYGALKRIGLEGDETIAVIQDLIFRQLNIVGHWTFSKIIQADCARFIADRRIDLDRLFTHRREIGQATQAYQLFDQGKTGKGVFTKFD